MAGGVILLMAQIDDAPGELLGHIIDKMTDMGAKNVQLLSSLGKKGRPAYVLLVDINAEDEPEFASLLVGDLGIWGYRVLESQHKHFDIRRYKTQLELKWAGGEASYPLRLKRILNYGVFVRAKAEHDDLVAISAQMRDLLPVSVAVLKAAIETAVGSAEPGETLHVDLSGLQLAGR
ncbi:pyridinium-3,5-bisthiocarboxylic acid mononucleotide nickel chelatase [Mesorhizobium sp. VK22B]|uniref:Pyridinium-3,5-bisthiocarboxylic acid mononucleotide nickel chelatase n=1 Tax=Mesorhizobium captivum TaxID=3072319 RepID=A0ABU4ZBU8_9HYPH|nr:nickel insertion protein [Mesorhizobium sp. VK22B]MDX8496356.1 pyridinium-3,5-bisthiocarboxylic acid mononucleotide nickel chelatase [Mesorhizobium sp. VK22B]